MKVTVAMDSFKGSLSTLEAGNAVKSGILRAYPDATVTVCPMADGGEGTAEAIVLAGEGEWKKITVKDPLSRPIAARYGYIPREKTAVVEMAAAAGITLIAHNERNPMKTTTYGVGEMILDAIERGCRNFLIGIGGSATNDGGTGMLAALGFAFLDENGDPIPLGAEGLSRLCEIRTEGADARLRECTFRVACDVTNVLCGKNGCSAVYGPQKGATPEMILQMDAFLARFAALTGEVLPASDPDFPGAGAAGGMGFALRSYLGATLVSGVELVTEATHLEAHVKDADAVVMGEGRLDGQSVMGKAPIGVASLAKRHGKITVALAGCVTPDATLCNAHGIDAYFPIVQAPCTLDEAMNAENARRNLAATAEQAFRLIKASRGE